MGNAIDPLNEEVVLAVGAGNWVIPAGSFRRTRSGSFVLQGTLDSGAESPSRLGVVIRPLRDGRLGPPSSASTSS